MKGVPKISRRWVIPVLAAALAVEAFAASMLRYVPRVGAPREPNLWLRASGDVAALIHAPGILLSNFLCVKLCPPNFVLQATIISGGYLGSAIIVLVAMGVFRAWRRVLSGARPGRRS